MAKFHVLIVAIPVLESELADTADSFLAAYPAAAIAEIQRMTDTDYLLVNLLEFESFCTVYYRNRPDLVDFMAAARSLFNHLLHEVLEKKIGLSTSPGAYGWSVRDIVAVATPHAVRIESITQSFQEDVIEAFEAWRRQLVRQVAAVNAMLADSDPVPTTPLVDAC